MNARIGRCCALVIAVLLSGWSASAQAQGFQLERYEPTPAGSWFFAVPHPWYSSTRWFAAGLTLDYGHDPLLAGVSDANGNFHTTTEIVAHQLVGHVDLAGSFLDRVQVHATLPVVLLERGSPAFDLAPLSGVVVGDPRLGAMVRIWGQPDGPVSLHAGGAIWIPIGEASNHAGDKSVRGRVDVVLAGLDVGHLRWVFDAGFVARGSAAIDPTVAQVGSRVGHALSLSAAVAYADPRLGFQIGPELVFDTVVIDGHAFKRDYSQLELLVGGQYHIAKQVMIGAAAGFGLVPEIGVPDYRGIFRIAYAPIRAHDRDKDGVPDEKDLCPDEPAGPHPDPARLGCPIRDRDRDGIADERDLCPDEPAGANPDPTRLGCPIHDRDKDGVPDEQDLCPDEPAGARPDPKKLGCPIHDRDKDGVPDEQDLCPDEPAGDHPDPKKLGCPFHDRDKDGVTDDQDQCPDTPAGSKPDPARPGCPLDTDGDGIPDEVDACPQLPGPPNADPKLNGCPELKKGEHFTLKAVHFEFNKATLLTDSRITLDEVVRILGEHPEVKHVIIEGHTDDVGSAGTNLRLSSRRAKAVRDYLVGKGLSRSRLKSIGYGNTQPISPDKTEEGRALNRRVEMRIQ